MQTEHFDRSGKTCLDLLFRAALWVFMLLNFLTRGVNRVPAALFLCLSSTNLMRINFNKHLAGLTVSPVDLQIRRIFYFKHILRGHSAAREVAFHPLLEQRSWWEHKDLCYYFLTWPITYFTWRHGPLTRDAVIQHSPSLVLPWGAESPTVQNGAIFNRTLGYIRKHTKCGCTFFFPCVLFSGALRLCGTIKLCFSLAWAQEIEFKVIRAHFYIWKINFLH